MKSRFSSSLFFILAILILLATSALAQTTYPRVGLSASPDSHVDTITVVPGEEFTLYACVFGHAAGGPVDQPFTSLSWVTGVASHWLNSPTNASFVVIAAASSRFLSVKVLISNLSL